MPVKGSSWLPVWITVAVAAHAFALFWVLKSLSALRVLRCSSKFDIVGVFKCLASLRRKNNEEHEESVDVATAEDPVWTSSVFVPEKQDGKRPILNRPAVLAWKDVGCSYPGPNGTKKTVLRGAAGVVCSGQLAGLLGPSGGGKSTLLETLAGHKSVGLITGRIGLRDAAHHDNARRYQATQPLTGNTTTSSSYVNVSKVSTPARVSADIARGVAGNEPSGVYTSQGGGDAIQAVSEPGSVKKGCSMESSHLVWRDIKSHAKAVKHVSAFVPQDNVFPPSLTADEVMWMYASLLGVENSGGACGCDNRREAMRSAVQSALQGVGLGQQGGTLVGGPLPGGLLLRGLSGGERKRLAVASGLLGNPKLLLLDEPTTGLDASAAASVMSRLSWLCHNHGMAVLCSLHQPRAAIWNLLDVVVVVSQGHLMYSGCRQGLVPWLAGQGYAYRPEYHGSPPDWVMDLVNITFAKPQKYYMSTMSTETDLATAAAAFIAQWDTSHAQLVAEIRSHATSRRNTPAQQARSSSVSTHDAGNAAVDVEGAASGGLNPMTLASKLKALISRGRRSDKANASSDSINLGDASFQQLPVILPPAATAAVVSGGDLTPANASAGSGCVGTDTGGGGGGGGGGIVRSEDYLDVLPTLRGASWLKQVWVLMWREWAVVSRNPADLAGRSLVYCWAALVAGMVFYAMPPDIHGMRSRSIVLYAEACVLLLLPFVYMSLFTNDRRIFVGELSSRLYHPSAYYASKATLMTIDSTINSIIFTAVVYGMSGLVHQPGPLFAHMFVATLGSLCVQQVLYFAAILSPNQDVAFMVAIAWTAVNILLANYPMRLVEYTMKWVRPLRYISAMYHVFSGLLAIEFHNVAPFDCSEGLGDAVIKMLPDYLPTISAIRLPFVQNTLTRPGANCRLDPQSLLDYFSVNLPWYVYACILLGYLGLIHMASYGVLLLTAQKEKR